MVRSFRRALRILVAFLLGELWSLSIFLEVRAYSRLSLWISFPWSASWSLVFIVGVCGVFISR